MRQRFYGRPLVEPAEKAGVLCRPSHRGISVTPVGDTDFMSTQLRLITKAEARKPCRESSSARPLRARRVKPRARRAVHWQGQWLLDDRTRRIGKAGVASARDALARAHPDSELREAS
jgi:hypothetical protein